MALVHALQVALIGGHRAYALVIVGQRAGDGQLATAALAFGFLGRRGLGRARLAGTALLGALFFFFILQAAARRLACLRRLGSFETAGGFLLGPLLGQFVGGLARLFFYFALFGGDVLGLELLFLAAAAFGILFRDPARFAVGDAGIGQGRGAAGLFLVGELTQHHAAGRRSRLGRLGIGLGSGDGLLRRLFGGLGAGLAGGTADRFFSTTTALVRPWLKLCLTVEVSVFFSDSVLAGRLVSSVSLMTFFL